MKDRIVRFVIGTVLALMILYTGLSCVFTWHKAVTQPYLVSGSVRYDFCGYYIMAAVNGIFCIFLILVFALVIVKLKKAGDNVKPKVNHQSIK